MPALGILAAILAFLAMRSIAASEGRTAGRPLALIAMFLGLGVAILQGAVVIGAVRVVADIRNTLVPAASQFITEANSGDTDQLRDRLAPAVANNLTDESIARFTDALQTELGPNQRVHLTIGAVLASAAELRARATPGSSIPNFDARPIVIEGAKSSAVAYAFLDEAAFDKDKLLFVDFLVVLAESDRAITLRPEGPAAQVARALNLATSESP